MKNDETHEVKTYLIFFFFDTFLFKKHAAKFIWNLFRGPHGQDQDFWNHPESLNLERIILYRSKTDTFDPKKWFWDSNHKKLSEPDRYGLVRYDRGRFRPIRSGSIRFGLVRFRFRFGSAILVREGRGI